MDLSQKYPNEEYPGTKSKIYSTPEEAKRAAGKHHELHPGTKETFSNFCPSCNSPNLGITSNNRIRCNNCHCEWSRGERFNPPTTYQPVTTEALELVNGDRRQDYGEVQESFEGIAKDWNLELENQLKYPITAQQVARMMIRFKLRRERNKHKRDNLVDICGYAELHQMLYEP